METKTQYGRVYFIEYTFAKPGQHFITVMIKIDGNKHILGKVYREYIKETNSMKYTANDRFGNQLFPDAKSLYEIKNKFKAEGKRIAEFTIPNDGSKAMEKIEIPTNVKENREKELNDLREEKGKSLEKSADKTINRN